MLKAFKGFLSQAMEIKAFIPLFKIKFEKFCNNYALKILKFKENHAIKKAYIEETNKDRDELEASFSFSFSSSSRNSIIKHLLQPKTQLLSLVSKIKQLVQNWKIEKIPLKWQKLWSPPVSAFLFYF